MNLVLTRGREGVQNPEKLEDVICTCSLMPNPPAISAHQWVAVDNPLAAAVFCLSIFPAFLARGLSPIFIIVFRRLRSEGERIEGREYIGRRI